MKEEGMMKEVESVRWRRDEGGSEVAEERKMGSKTRKGKAGR